MPTIEDASPGRSEIDCLLDVIEGLLCAYSHDENKGDDEGDWWWPDAQEEAEAALTEHGRL